MATLAAHELHTLQPERWNAYGQLTYIHSFKLPFAAAYTDVNGSNHSLAPQFEQSFTGTLTAFVGVALWPGAALFVVPEVITEQPLSQLHGLGGAIQNFELQKTGGLLPVLYLSRAYLTQTFNVGGTPVARASEAMQLGGQVDSRRLVVTVGNFSILDFFDKNTFAGDLRRQFFNMAFLTHAAYDFAADARGYAWGAVIEYYHEGWELRLARLTPPLSPNQLPLDFRLTQFFGDQLELVHWHSLNELPGALHVLAFRNQENMGRFADAIAAWQTDPQHNAAACSAFNYGSANSQAPDVCWVRTPHAKVGVGLNFEQRISSAVGVFFRTLVSDGASEVYSYTSADQSLSVGILARGDAWARPDDLVGAGFGASWISSSHAAYLNAGGIDGFIGDGHLQRGSEQVVEGFYSAQVLGPTFFSADYQLITNPGYNAARGPVHILGLRVHATF